MWNLAPQDLYRLKGAGGEAFVQFCDRLIRADAHRGGVSQGEIAIQLRVNIKDGGVDTEVRAPIPGDANGWFTVPTCWQFKAVGADAIDDKKKTTKHNELQEEVYKPYAKKLIALGYGYRLCLLGDLTPEKLKDWESQLKTEVRAINPTAPGPRVVHGGHLLQWAERFPAVVAWLLESTLGVLHWEAWAANRRKVTPHYVPNPPWGIVAEQILRHIRFEQPTANPCLPIGGAAGVGKSRLVFETLNILPQAAGIVVVAEDEEEARKLVTGLANSAEQTAILVADECGPQVRFFLNETLRGHAHRVRVICIDNGAAGLTSVAAQVSLSHSDASNNTEAILAQNFPAVRADRRQTYAVLSRGFVRLAADMCQHDADLVAGEMAGLLRSVEEYARHRVGNHLPLLSALALFDKVGFKDDVSHELESLCQLTGCRRQDFLDAVRLLRESPGFVVQAGRYWYVTPEIVARVLFGEGWQRWVCNDLNRFLKMLDEPLRKRLLERASTHGGREVRDQLHEFFRGWLSRLTARDLADPAATSLAGALVEASPEECLPRLRAVVEAASPSELQDITGYASGASWGPRRTLVWLLERLVAFREFFADCEAILFRLALEETEPQIANNATAIWANLFSIHFSGTAVPFEERLPLLRRRTSAPDPAEVRLAFDGLARALTRLGVRVKGEPIVSGRLRPDDWHPGSPEIEKVCLRATLRLCGQHLEAGGEQHRLTFQALVRSLDFLLHCGLLDELRSILAPKWLTDQEVRVLLRVLDQFQGLDLGRPAETEGNAVRYFREVREWSNQLRPADFSGMLRAVCAREPWDARSMASPEAEVDNLAAHIVANPSLLNQQLDWLASSEARLTEPLGLALGRVDETASCATAIAEHAIERKAITLLRGYMRGTIGAGRCPTADLARLVAKLESSHPELAVDILGCAGDSLDGFNRIMRLVESKAVLPELLTPIAYGVGGRELTCTEIGRILPHFVAATDSCASVTVSAGLWFLNTYLIVAGRGNRRTCLESQDVRSLAWQFVEAALPFVSGNNVYYWVEIVSRLSKYDPNRAALTLSRTLLEEDLNLEERAAGRLAELATTAPEAVMAGFGNALLDPDRGWRLQIHVLRDLVVRLPTPVVMDWIREHGLAGARAIARHLPLPFIDEGDAVVPELLDTVLREYDDDKVLVNFIAGTHSGEVWWGNGADRLRSEAEVAGSFLNHSNPRIRQWAQLEMDHRLQLAERDEREQAEQGLSF